MNAFPKSSDLEVFLRLQEHLIQNRLSSVRPFETPLEPPSSHSILLLNRRSILHQRFSHQTLPQRANSRRPYEQQRSDAEETDRLTDLQPRSFVGDLEKESDGHACSQIS